MMMRDPDTIDSAFHEWLKVIKRFFQIDLIDIHGNDWDVHEFHDMWWAMYEGFKLHAGEFQSYSEMERYNTIQEDIHKFRSILNTVESYNIPFKDPQTIYFIRKSTNIFEENLYHDISG
jgi:hypothetical protein